MLMRITHSTRDQWNKNYFVAEAGVATGTGVGTGEGACE